MYSDKIPRDIDKQELFYAAKSTKNAIAIYGLKRYLDSLDQDVYWALYKYFHE